MAYSSWSVVYGEVPSAAKWNILGTNDASFNDGTGLPVGTCVQIAQNVTSAVATGTTTVPLDDTIPQQSGSAEGDQYMTQAITPRSATNLLVIEATMFLSHSGGVVHLISALYQDSTASALAVAAVVQVSATSATNTKLVHTMTAGTTSSTTFKIRCGSATPGTTTFNGLAAARYFGAIPKSSLIIREYTV